MLPHCQLQASSQLLPVQLQEAAGHAQHDSAELAAAINSKAMLEHHKAEFAKVKEQYKKEDSTLPTWKLRS